MKKIVIPYIEGDGIGKDIWKAARMVFDEVLKRYAPEVIVEWRKLFLFSPSGVLSDEVIRVIHKHKVAIKGPLTTPVGSGIRSFNVLLRKTFDLYATVRPISYFQGVPSPMKHPEYVDMIVFRENIEDVYAGIEFRAFSEEADEVRDFFKKKFGFDIRTGSGIGIKPMSKFGSQRLIRLAIKYAIDHGRRSVTLVHKGNIMKFTEGAFVTWGYELAKKEFAKKVVLEAELNGKTTNKIVLKDCLADIFFQQALLKPQEYDVIATSNLNGDYLSDALAAQVGGIGLVPSANIGDELALFETTHGSAQKYAGKNVANPSSLILSGAMMFDYLGLSPIAEKIKGALQRTFKHGCFTQDLARLKRGAAHLSTTDFAHCIIHEME